MRTIEEIFNLTDEEVITKVLEKDPDGSYKDLMCRKLLKREDLVILYNMTKDMFKLFDYGVDVRIYVQNGFCTLKLLPTHTLIVGCSFLDNENGTKDIEVRDQLIHVYNNMKKKLRPELLELVQYIRDNNYNFVTSLHSGERNQYSIELYSSKTDKDIDEITVHMSRDIVDIEEFKKAIDGIAKDGYGHIIQMWREDMLDKHRYRHNRSEMYYLNFDEKEYCLFHIFNSRTTNAKHHFILIDSTWGSETYHKVITDEETLNKAIALTKQR